MCFSIKHTAVPLSAVALSASIFLSGCYPAPPEERSSLAEHALTAAPAFADIPTTNTAEIQTQEQANKLLGDVFFRFLDIVGFTNHRVGEFGSGDHHFPSFEQPQMSAEVTLPKNKLILQSVASGQCAGEQDNTTNETVPVHSFAIVWDDVDNDQRGSAPDLLHHVYNDCTEKYSNINFDGVLTFYGKDFVNFFAGNYTTNSTGGTNTVSATNPKNAANTIYKWSELQVKINLQSTNAYGDTALVKDAVMTMNQTGNINTIDITPAPGATKALFGMKTGDNRYLFSIDHARVSYDLDTDNEKISFHGTYFDTATGGTVSISTDLDNEIVFHNASRNFDMRNMVNMTGEHAKLHSGKFTITAKNDKIIRVATTANPGVVTIEFDGKTTTLPLTDIVAEMAFPLISLE